MPAFKGYGGGYQSRPKRRNQLDIVGGDLPKNVWLAKRCPCGWRGSVVVAAAEYYAVGFKLTAKCPDCLKKL